MLNVFKINREKSVLKFEQYAETFHVKFVTTNISCYRIFDYERCSSSKYKKDAYGVYSGISYLSNIHNFFYHRKSSRNTVMFISGSMFAKLND